MEGLFHTLSNWKLRVTWWEQIRKCEHTEVRKHVQIYTAKRVGNQIFQCLLAPPFLSLSSGITVKISKQGWGVGEAESQKLRWRKLFSDCVWGYESMCVKRVCVSVCESVCLPACDCECEHMCLWDFMERCCLVIVPWKLYSLLTKYSKKKEITDIFRNIKGCAYHWTPLLSVRKIKDSLLRQLRFLQIPRKSYFYQPGINGCEEEGRLVLMTTSQKKKKDA